MAVDMIGFMRHIHTEISEQAWFTTDGFDKSRIHKQNLPATPVFPCMVTAYQIDETEVFADIAQGKLFVTVYCQEFNAAEQVAQKVIAFLHRYTYGDDTLVIHKCHNIGGPPLPAHENSIGAWEAPTEFDIAVA